MTHDPDGLVFDLDGTLADTATIGRAALDATVAAFGITPTGDAMALNGRAFADRIRVMRENGDLDDTITDADLLAECDRQLITRAAGVRPLAPVVAILRQAHGRVPLALATGSTGAVAEAVVAAIGLAGVFDAVVTRDDVARGKPAPDTYLRAAALLGLEPARCVAYEDTAIGLAAASAAGMSVVDVRPWCGTTFRVEELSRPCHRSPVDRADEHERTMDPSRSTGVHIGRHILTSPPAGEPPC